MSEIESGYKYGWYRTEDGKVVVGKKDVDGVEIQGEYGDEKYSGHTIFDSIEDYDTSDASWNVKRGRTKLKEGRAILWGNLSPLVFCDGEAVLTWTTRVYHEEERRHYRPHEINVTFSSEHINMPIVTFETMEGKLMKRWTGEELEEMFEQGVLKTDSQINNEAEDILNEARDSS